MGVKFYPKRATDKREETRVNHSFSILESKKNHARASLVARAPVRASRTIYIRADGSIDPPTAPIYTVDNITYTLTGNVTADANGIAIERDNIVVDGAGYAVTGSGSGNGTTLTSMSNLTVRNMTIKDFLYGIELSYSSGNRFLET